MCAPDSRSGVNGQGVSGDDTTPLTYVATTAASASTTAGAIPNTIADDENFPSGPERNTVGALRYRIYSKWDDCYLADLHDHCVSGDPGIQYKQDEENTSADNDCIMSTAAGDALDRLQTLTKAEWGAAGGVYVTDAWDGDGGHSSHSLHFEGRAIDMVPADFDMSKLPRFASLAATAGFEWVYNEGDHVHASVSAAPDACVLVHPL